MDEKNESGDSKENSPQNGQPAGGGQPHPNSHSDILPFTVNDDFLSFFLDSPDQGLWALNLIKNQAYFSPACYTMLGYEPGAFPPALTSWDSITHPDDLPLVKASEQECLNGTETEHQIKVRMKSASGAWHWIFRKCKAIHQDLEGRPTLLFGIHRDITGYCQNGADEKQFNPAQPGLSAQEAALLKTAHTGLRREARINSVLADIADRILTPDSSLPDIAEVILNECMEITASRHGYVSSIDPVTRANMAHTLTGMQPGSCPIRHGAPQISFHKGPDGAYPSLWGLSLNTGAPVISEDPKSHPASVGVPDGHVDIKRLLSFPVKAGGEIVGQIALANAGRPYDDKDIEAVSRVGRLFSLAIQRQHSADELKKAKEEAESANMAKTQFLARITHEVRSPLNTIIGMTDLTLDSDLTPRQREYLGMVRSSSQHLLALTEDLMDVSKVETGKIVLENSPFNLRAGLKEITKAHSIKAKQKGLRFSFKIDPRAPDAWIGDLSRLRQVVNNLLNNAVKFTSEGEISIKAWAEGVRKSPAEIHLSIRDTGCGIPSEKLGYIFEPFVQVNPSREPGLQGTGLGLTISRDLVHLMGGEIGVKSALGEGSRFSFYIKSRINRRIEEQDSPSEKPASRPADKTKCRPLKILVAEDNQDIYMLIRILLERRGHRVWHAEDGLMVLEELKKRNVDLILMDIQMPQMDGFEVTDKIRKNEPPDRPRLPIVALTAYAGPNDRRRFLEAGMDDCIFKPIDTSQLDQVISRFTPKP